MSIRGLGRLKHWIYLTHRYLSSQVVILLYHRVVELGSDPQWLSVSPERFAEHLQIIRSRYPVMSLRSLVDRMMSGNLPRRAVVITFDDGYADNFYMAKPLLEQYEIPATVFVTAGSVGKSEEFWWDDLDRILLQPGTLPAMIQASVDGEEYQQNLGAVSEYGVDFYRMHQHWTVLSPDNPTERQIAYRRLCQLVYSLSVDRRQDVQRQLWQQFGSGSVGRDTHRVMNPQEVAQLAANGLIEVGAHTMSHLSLAAQPIAVQRSEIQQSKARLEEILGQPVTSFAYPFGSPTDYSTDTVDLVQEAGFRLACSNFGGVVTRQSDRFQLPRFLVRNWDGDEFERRLREWLA